MTEIYHRQDVLSRMEEMRDRHPGKPLDWYAVKCGISKGTYFRWQQQGFTPTERNVGGRPAKFVLEKEEALALRALALKHDSTQYAIEIFSRSEHCRPQTRELILDILDRAARRDKIVRWPESLRKAAYVTQAEKNEFRGRNRASSRSLAPRKGMFWRDAQGEDHALRTHSAWMMDDYSTNQPYIIQTSDGATKLCRQMLVCQDVYSAMWLGVETIGRERDQYRAEDILRFILHCIDAQGTMPARLVLERGRWDSKAIHGLEVWDGHRHVLWGGLGDIIDISNGFDSRHKAALEVNLDVLQTTLAHSGEDIGRKRGEFETATRKYLSVQQQARMIAEGGTPRSLKDAQRMGFLTQDDALELHAVKMDELNRRAKKREAFDKAVVPMDLMRDTITPRPLPVEERWRFLPVKREATIRRGGLIEVAVKEYPRSFIFAVNGQQPDVCLENGYKVLIAFDPARPDQGCIVANAETGVKNRENYRFGQRLLTAPMMQDVPQWDESPREGASLKKKAAAQVRTGFAGIKRHLRDDRALRVHQAHDDAGQVTRRTNKRDEPMITDEAPAPPRTVARRALDADVIAARERKLMEEETFA
jgi:hypothetical protein